MKQAERIRFFAFIAMKQANSHACVSIALYCVSIKSVIRLSLFCFVLLQFLGRLAPSVVFLSASLQQ